MRFAHLSDPHVVDWEGLPWRAFGGKRITGLVNFRLFRSQRHQAGVLHALVDDLHQQGPDHVVVTGDVTSMGFAQEFKAFRDIMLAAVPDSSSVTMVPGNHDAYTREVWRTHRFLRELGDFARSDLPLAGGGSAFPFVRLRGPVAFLGLSTAVPRPWFFANGFVGQGQLDRLVTALAHREVRARFPVILMHHPPVAYRRWHQEVQSGLLDRARVLTGLRRALAGRPALVLSGHWHRAERCRLDIPGQVELLVVPSASHAAGGPGRAAAYHLVEVEPGRAGQPAQVTQLQLRQYQPDQGRFQTVALPSLRAD